MKQTFHASLFSALLVAISTGVTPVHAQGRTYALEGGRWFDGERFVEQTLYSVDGVFSESRPARIDSTIYLNGNYIVPPFGEAHNHNVEGSRAGETGRRYLAAGVFYVKNPNSLPGARERLAGEVNIPTNIDVVFASGGITAALGHPVGLVRQNTARGVFTEADGEGAFIYTVEALADVDVKLPLLFAQRPDFIKTYLLYSEEYELRRGDTTYFDWQGLNPDLLRAIVRRAHEAGLRVSTHVETAADFENAVRAGTDEINHLPGFRQEERPNALFNPAQFRISEYAARLAAERRTVVVTTVAGLLEHARRTDLDPGEAPLVAELADVVRQNLQTLKRHRVRVAIGTDIYQRADASEARNLARLGIYSNLELLKMWAEDTPATIFPGRKLGKLAAGYEASFLALSGNPLDDFGNTQRIALRMKQGVLLP